MRRVRSAERTGGQQDRGPAHGARRVPRLRLVPHDRTTTRATSAAWNGPTSGRAATKPRAGPRAVERTEDGRHDRRLEFRRRTCEVQGDVAAPNGLGADGADRRGDHVSRAHGVSMVRPPRITGAPTHWNDSAKRSTKRSNAAPTWRESSATPLRCGPWYSDVSRNFEDRWEAAEFALGCDQLGVYDQDMFEGAVETPQFLHDQTAKGAHERGSRDR